MKLWRTYKMKSVWLLYSYFLSYNTLLYAAAYKVSCPYDDQRYTAKDRVLGIENHSFGQISATTLDGIVTAIPDLQTLILRRTNITSLTLGTFRNLQSIRCLDLSNNSLSVLKKGSFQGLSKLETLILADNALVDVLDNAFIDLPNLRTLDLSRNYLSVISPTTFTGLANLEELHLQHNYLTKLHPLTFESVPNLRRLYLHRNPLRSDGGSFRCLQTLKTLVLTHTLLGWIPDFSDSVRILDLEGCRLQSIPVAVRSKLLKLERLWLSQNPWTCNCSAIGWLVNELTNQSRDNEKLSNGSRPISGLEDYEKMTCHFPREFRGLNFSIAFGHGELFCNASDTRSEVHTEEFFWLQNDNHRKLIPDQFLEDQNNRNSAGGYLNITDNRIILSFATIIVYFV